MQGLMHTFSLAMFCKLIICGQSLGSAMVHSAWPAVVHLFQNVLYFLPVNEVLICFTDTWVYLLWAGMHYVARAMNAQGSLCGGSDSISLSWFYVQIWKKMSTYATLHLARGIWGALVSIHPCPTLAIICCLYYRPPRNLQCTLELQCVLRRLPTRPSESTVATPSVALLIVSNWTTSYQE